MTKDFGLQPLTKDERAKTAKLDKQQVIAIYWAYHRDKKSAPTIAKEYGVSKSAVLGIANRTSWRNVDVMEGEET
jgi:predicted DNA-binding protein YlxM (UPF0122 family)